MEQYDEEEQPLTLEDFKKRFQIKHSMYGKKDGTGLPSGDLHSTK